MYTQRLKDLLASIATKALRLEEVFKEAVAIFEDLVKQLESAPIDRREQLLAEMREMAELLSKTAPELYAAAGVSEEEASQPQGLTEDQAKLLQSARDRLSQLSRQAIKSLKPSAHHPSPKKPRPPKRSEWMRP